MNINVFLLILTLSVFAPSHSLDLDTGDGLLLRNLPCMSRYNQLYCTGGGSDYPMGAINRFIEDNKALTRRMFGEMQERRSVTRTSVRIVQTYGQTSFVAAPLVDGQFSGSQQFQRVRRDVLEGTWEEVVEDSHTEERKPGNETSYERSKRQAEFPGNPEEDITKEDVCESKVEVTTPFWATNSNGKVRAILNNKEFEQAVHQEICTKSSTLRCTRDCSCEQKYKWHRLMSYDPNNDCSGVFMDWFLFPSCCTCRCLKNPFLGK